MPVSEKDQRPEVPTPQNGDTTALNNDDIGTTAEVPTTAVWPAYMEDIIRNPAMFAV